ncbi:hypothetical protein VTI74DRAFT_8339 [Chaetomium olivicolor]
MNTDDVQDVPPLDEAEVSDELGDDLSEPPLLQNAAQSAGSRPGYVAAGGYNSLKSFNGRVYSGMAIGGSHTWNYDQGQWKETKVEPDLWKIDFETTKRRARNAPKGSGAPVGTEYHWLVVAHQHVKKIDANTYETRLVGSKYKLAHKLASSNSWSVPTVKAQREREFQLLEDAKRRVQGLPPVVASEKVRTTKDEKGQQKLDALFARVKGTKGSEGGNTKRKREVFGGDNADWVSIMTAFETLIPSVSALYLSDTYLPPEVLQQIICWLDPISLIALSQTSRSWRALINPLPHDFEQRLLALELQPEHGGLVPVWDENKSTINPSWESDEWKTAKYACCGCMKLLTHMMFDTHALLRRPYRKPPLGSEQAKRMAFTDWEPLEPDMRQRRIHQRAFQERKERQNWVQMAKDYNEPEMLTAHPFARLPSRREEAAQLANKHLSGTARHKRRCVECLYRRQDGRKEVTRRWAKLELHEKYFPGLLPATPPEQTARIYQHMKTFHSTLSVIRCDGCGVWQREGAFRLWPFLEFLQRQSEGPLLCNGCHLRTYNDTAKLARELNEVFSIMLNHTLRSTRASLGFGWRLIHQDFNTATSQYRGALLSQYKAIGDEILDGLQWESETPFREALVEDSLLPDLRRRFLRYKNFIYNEVPAETRAELVQSWFQLWLEDYDLLEESYRELKRQIARFESDPNLVVNYVMEKEPYRLQ